MFVPAFPPHAQLDQSGPQFIACAPVTVRQSQPKRAVRKPDFKSAQHLCVFEPALFQIRQRRSRLHQAFMVIVEHLPHQRPIIRRRIQRAFEPGHRVLADRPATLARCGVSRGPAMRE